MEIENQRNNEKALETNEVVVGWNGDNGDFRSMDCSEEIEEDFRIEGTSAYLPPEVVLGAIPTPAADTWALGCLLYQCLTGLAQQRCARGSTSCIGVLMFFLSNISLPCSFLVRFDGIYNLD